MFPRRRGQQVISVEVRPEKTDAPKGWMAQLSTSWPLLVTSILSALVLISEGNNNRREQERSLVLTQQIAALERTIRESDHKLAAERSEQELRREALKFTTEHLDVLRSTDNNIRSAAIRIFLATFPQETAAQLLNTLYRNDDQIPSSQLADMEDHLPVSALVFNYRSDPFMAETCAAALRAKSIPTVVFKNATGERAGMTEVRYFESIDGPTAERVAHMLTDAGCASHARRDAEPKPYPPRWRTLNVIVPERS